MPAKFPDFSDDVIVTSPKMATSTCLPETLQSPFGVPPSFCCTVESPTNPRKREPPTTRPKPPKSPSAGNDVTETKPHPVPADRVPPPPHIVLRSCETLRPDVDDDVFDGSQSLLPKQHNHSSPPDSPNDTRADTPPQDGSRAAKRASKPPPPTPARHPRSNPEVTSPSSIAVEAAVKPEVEAASRPKRPPVFNGRFSSSTSCLQTGSGVTSDVRAAIDEARQKKVLSRLAQSGIFVDEGGSPLISPDHETSREMLPKMEDIPEVTKHPAAETESAPDATTCDSVTSTQDGTVPIDSETKSVDTLTRPARPFKLPPPPPSRQHASAKSASTSSGENGGKVSLKPETEAKSDEPPPRNVVQVNGNRMWLSTSNLEESSSAAERSTGLTKDAIRKAREKKVLSRVANLGLVDDAVQPQRDVTAHSTSGTSTALNFRHGYKVAPGSATSGCDVIVEQPEVEKSEEATIRGSVSGEVENVENDVFENNDDRNGNSGKVEEVVEKVKIILPEVSPPSTPPVALADDAESRTSETNPLSQVVEKTEVELFGRTERHDVEHDAALSPKEKKSSERITQLRNPSRGDVTTTDPKNPTGTIGSVKSADRISADDLLSTTGHDDSGEPVRMMREPRPKSIFPSDFNLARGWASEQCLVAAAEGPAAACDGSQPVPSPVGQRRPPPAVPVRRTPVATCRTPEVPTEPKHDVTSAGSATPTEPPKDNRKSYLVMADVVGKNFTFLDEFEDSGNIDAADPSLSATGSVLRRPKVVNAPGGSDVISPEVVAPPAGARRSVRLSNGTLIELIGDAFTFLDDFETL